MLSGKYKHIQTSPEMFALSKQFEKNLELQMENNYSINVCALIAFFREKNGMEKFRELLTHLTHHDAKISK